MHRLIPFIGVALLVCGCSAEAAHDPAPPAAVTTPAAVAGQTLAHLDGTQWRFVEVAGASVPPAVTATLRFAHGHASGKAGCNSYGASYSVSADGVAHFQQTLSTKMACLQPKGAMQVEHGIFAAFRQTTKLEASGDDLLLLDANGIRLARLARVVAVQH